jgi:hypothetical protein
MPQGIAWRAIFMITPGLPLGGAACHNQHTKSGEGTLDMLGLRKTFDALNRLDDRLLGLPAPRRRYLMPRYALLGSIFMVIAGPVIEILAQTRPPDHQSAFYGAIGGLWLGCGIMNIARYVRERDERRLQSHDGRAEDL